MDDPRTSDGTTVLYASLPALAIAGPLLSLMGFTLLTSLALLLVAAPLQILFSPILLPAGFVVAAAVVAFGTAGAMGLGGLWALNWAFGYATRGPADRAGPTKVAGPATETLTESGQRVKERAQDFGGYLQYKVDVLPPENAPRKENINET
ncbi:oleosin 5-like [Ananas comosus]|uniref:Oleosin 5-like n=1 Tax=Ananas comosus TaxID=4615 RepID=A0A6P5F575_ANACO|nr:oleosin 5-like [Ananas comosus]